MTKTVVAERYGGPEVRASTTSRFPQSASQVIVDVRATGTNPVDCKCYRGHMGDDPDALPMSVGMEAAAVVEAPARTEGYTGPLKTGEVVIVTNIRGTYADKVVAEEAVTGHKPAARAFEASAGLLLIGGTVWHLLTKAGVGQMARCSSMVSAELWS